MKRKDAMTAMLCSLPFLCAVSCDKKEEPKEEVKTEQMVSEDKEVNKDNVTAEESLEPVPVEAAHVETTPIEVPAENAAPAEAVTETTSPVTSTAPETTANPTEAP
jgi:cell division septation protein DedD